MMPASPASAPTRETHTLGDFELVRNAEGNWLLILAQLPDAMIDNPLDDIRMRLDDTQLIVENMAACVAVSSILASHYIRALRDDNPASVILSVVDDEGVQVFSRRIPITLS